MNRGSSTAAFARLFFVSLVGLIVMAPIAAGAQGPVSALGTRTATETASVPQDPGWPRILEKDGSQLVIYQPQIDRWQDYARIGFRCAIALTPAGESQPAYGVLAVKANTQVDHDARTVLLQNLDVEARFPNLPADQATRLAGMAQQAIKEKQTIEVSLDRVMAYIKNQQARPAGVQLNIDPPPIYHSESPAILVIYMGRPQFKPVKDTTLSFAINTNWDVFQDQDTKQYYLQADDAWLTSPDPLKGPWSAAARLPESFSKLPDDDKNWESVRQHIPARAAESAPRVFTSTKPAELIVTDGAPALSPIAGTKLSYVSNPVQPLFKDSTDGKYYFLVAGRWFTSPRNLDGPWSAASTSLPADFARIPRSSPVGFVLASIPKTQEAEDAVLLASVPHKAAIDTSKATVNVTYEGQPQFAPIEGTSMKYAVNSPYQVILAEGQYYCCYQGVWFVAPAPQAHGAWRRASLM